MSALRKLVDLLKIPRSERDSKEKSITDQYTIENSGLYRLVEEGGKATKLYVIPSPIRKSVVVRYHDLAVHFSLDRTLRGIKQRNWFPRRQHTRSCIECFFTKTPGGRIPGKLHNMPPGERPFSIIHMDHMGPFIPSSKRNTHLLVIIDNVTRFTKLYAMNGPKTKPVKRAVEKLITQYGCPDRIITDRGTCFTSKELEDYRKSSGMEHTAHARANGMVERANRTILPVIMDEMQIEKKGETGTKD